MNHEQESPCLFVGEYVNCVDSTWYNVVSEKVQPRQTDNQGRVVALDPVLERS